jgi:hypothetical protein
MCQCILGKDKETAASVVKKHIDNQEDAIIRQLKLDKIG